ncbi:MAG: lipopolysaccharide heptosyltransferase II [Lentisphaeria bacterium]|nr:lipopolysaccharide heptosyltransferase II [Lentisphaeria bacterium]
MEFLILKPSSLGDIIHAFPAVNALLREYPGAVADWLIHPAFAELTAYLPGIRNNIFFQRKKLGKLSSFPETFRTLSRDIRANRYDAVIDLQGLIRSAAIGRLAKSRIYAGPANPKEGLAKVAYNRLLHAPADRHALERNNIMISDFLDKKELDFSFRMNKVQAYADTADKILADAGLKTTQKFAAVAPGARWITKQWPPAFFANVIKKIHADHPDLHFLLLGTNDDSNAAEQIAASSGVPCTNLCGKTSLGALVEIIRKTELFLCNDSGPMHIAAALDIPVLAFFGPTSPVLTGPYTKNCRVLQPSLPCITCFKRECAASTCHTAIDAGATAEAANELLKN